MAVPDIGGEEKRNATSIYALGLPRRRARIRAKSTAAGNRVTGTQSPLRNRIL